MAAGDAYITCLNSEAGAEALLRMVAVDSDGDLYIDCANSETSILDLLNLLIVEDATGNPALSVALTGTAGGTAEHEEFTTTAGQTIFNCAITLDAKYKVFVDGIFQSWGHTRVGDVVTFAIGFNAGHEVSIHQ